MSRPASHRSGKSQLRSLPPAYRVSLGLARVSERLPYPSVAAILHYTAGGYRRFVTVRASQVAPLATPSPLAPG